MTKKHPQKQPKHGNHGTPKPIAKNIVSPGDISDQDPKRRIGQYGGTGEPHSMQAK